jgi:hypothetical protein
MVSLSNHEAAAGALGRDDGWSKLLALSLMVSLSNHEATTIASPR